MGRAKVNFAIVCESAFTDSDGRLNIIQTFNIIRAPSFPAIHPKLSVVTNIEVSNSADRVTESVQIVHHDSRKELAKSEPVTLTLAQDSKVQLISNFVGVRFDKSGKYDVNIEIDGEKIPEVASFTVEKTG